MSENEVIVGLAAIVVLGVGAQWLGRRVGFPSLLLLLPAGLVAGATGVVEPEEMFGDTLFPGVTLLVGLLLFHSGLKLRLADLPRPARRLGLGVGVGAVAAGVLVFVLSQFLVTDDMEAAVAVLIAVLAFGTAEVVLSEAGLFATVTLGVVAANQRLAPTLRVSGFGETLEVLIIGTLFVVLGALVNVDDLASNAVSITILVLALVLVVRPLAAAVSLLGSSADRSDRAFIAWVDPRGVVAAATAAQFALTLRSAGFESSLMLPITFGVILGTGVIYGLTAPPVARALGVTAPRPTAAAFVGAAPWLVDLVRRVHDLGGGALLVTGGRPEEAGQRDDDVPMVSLRSSQEELGAAIESTPLALAVVAVDPQPVVNLLVADLIRRLGRRNVLVLPQDRRGTAMCLLETWTPQPFAPGIGMAEITRRVAAGAVVTPCPGGCRPTPSRSWRCVPTPRWTSDRACTAPNPTRPSSPSSVGPADGRSRPCAP